MIKIPEKDKTKATKNRKFNLSLKIIKANKQTYKGAVFMNKVALATDVIVIEECQNEISIPKHNPGIATIKSSLNFKNFNFPEISP